MREGFRHLGVQLIARAPRRALWLLSLTTLTVVASTLDNPGTLDASYHLHVAQNLAAGRGLVEDVIWNYLDKSRAALALPHASHLYWMPLTTWLAWLGLAAFDGLLAPFAAARVPFVLLASLVPLLAYELAHKLWQRNDYAWMAGLMTLAAPNYLQSWVVSEPETPYCLAAAGCFLACARAVAGARGWWLAAGAAAAAAHLTRADGALVLVAVALQAAIQARPWRSRLLDLALLGGSYLLLMAPWFARNFSLIGSPLPLSVTSTLWLHSYDEIFSYDKSFSAARWFSASAGTLLAEKSLGALAVLVLFAGMFQWVLPPLALAGFGRLPPARRLLVAPCLVYALLLLGCMALGFTHPAQFGSLFRGAAALVPWTMALVPGGLAYACERYARLRRAEPREVKRVLQPGLLAVIVVVAALFHVHRVHGIVEPQELWNTRFIHYREIERWLRAQGATGPVLVVDPPGFTLATGRPSIVVPSDGPRALRAAADRFGARWLILESNVPSLDAVWRSQAPLEGFRHVRQFRDELGDVVRVLVRSAP
jgi:hypothetical protein